MSLSSTNSFLLIFVTGPDQPGITASLMRSISHNKATIEDMGQSITHGFLSLNILLSIESKNIDSYLKLYINYKLKVKEAYINNCLKDKFLIIIKHLLIFRH